MSNYYKVSARLEFVDGYIYESMKHMPFDIKPFIDDVIRLEQSMWNNPLLKVELFCWDDDDNVIKIMDVTSNYLGGKID